MRDQSGQSQRLHHQDASTVSGINEGGDQKTQMIDIFGILRALRIYKWMILVLLVVGTGLGFFLGHRMLPEYTAATEILVETPKERGPLGIDSQREIDETALKTEVMILTSRSLVERIMQDAGLLDHDLLMETLIEQVEDSPSFSPWSFIGEALAWFGTDGESGPFAAPLPSEGGGAAEHSSFDEKILALSSFEERIEEVYEERIEDFYSRYFVQTSGDSYIITISYTSDDPREAAEIANRAASFYISQKLSSREDDNLQTSSWLEERVRTLRANLNQAERAIEQFRAENNLQNRRFDAVTQEMSGFSSELVKLKAELSSRQARLASLTDLRSNGQSVYNLPEVIDSRAIGDLRLEQRELRQRQAELANTFGPNHPEMRTLKAEQEDIKAKLSLEIDRIIQSLKDDVEITRQQKIALEREIRELRSQYAIQSDVEVQLRELERDADATRELYQAFLQRSKQLNEEKTITPSGLRVISKAAPPTLSSTPSSKMTAMVGFCISFLSGTLLAVLLGHQDQRIRSEQQISSMLGMRLVATIPIVKRLGKHQRPHEYMLDKPMSVYTDAIRNVLLDIKNDFKSNGTKVLISTSTLPNEGKTTFALSLAALAAHSGLRTLLIDLDLRHPSIHRELKVTAARDGLIEYVLDSKPFERVVWVHPQIKNFHAAMTMSPYEDPMEILESQKLQDFLEEARQSYDLVIIDSAPLFAVSEARTVAAIGDAAIFSIRWGETDLETAKGGLQKLKDNNINIFGAVLGQVDFRKHQMYHFRDAGHHYQKYKDYYVN